MLIEEDSGQTRSLLPWKANHHAGSDRFSGGTMPEIKFLFIAMPFNLLKSAHLL